ELKDHVVGILDLHDEWNETEVQEYEGFIGFSETSEKEKIMENRDNVGDGDDENGDDDENRDDDGGNMNNDVNDCDVNRDSDDVNECDKDPNRNNSSFGFSKISLEDFGNDSGPAEKDKVIKGNPTKQGTVVEGNEAEEGEIMSTPENFTQWLEKNVDLVGEESFSNQVNAQFKGNKDGLALGGIDLRDMLRRLRFKFATKILLHEINVHAENMLELAKEFDKTDAVEKMAIIVDAFKKREEQLIWSSLRMVELFN
nr:hypothetical protein [Tanacetum cinerariifolium]